MQGQKSFIGPLPDTMNFDNNTMSTDASVDQHIFWNNMQNSTNQVQNLSGWNVGESSCSGTQNYAILNEQNTNDGPASSLSLNNGDVNHNSQIPYSPLFMQSASNAVPQDRTMASEIIEYGLNCQAMDSSNMHKTAHASSSSAPFVLPSRGGGYFVEENEGRACKRKAIEGTAGQSSMSGSSSYFPPGGGNDWHNVPGWYNANGVSTSTSFENPSGVSPQDQANARLGLNGGGNTLVTPLSLNVATDLGSSRRNHRVRLNPSAQQESLPNVLSNGSTIGHNAPSYPQSSRLLPLNNFSDTRSPQSARWTRGSSSRAGYSLNFGERNAGPTEDTDSTTLLRNVSENPVFVSTNEMRSSTEISTDWGLTGGNTSRNLNIPGNVSRNVHPSSGPNGVPHRNAPRYSRRLSEYVRRSLLSSTVPEPGVQNSGNSRLHSGPSSQQMALSAGASDQGDRLSRLRSALLLERQLDSAFGSPHSLRTLAAGNEGRTRLVSEIRSVLDLMRRGGGLQLEDVVILDQSVFFGMADIHDRHRDMRLDVDNMSYEELLALEERIGNVSTGLSEETIFNHLKQRKYFSIAMGVQSDVEPCCICREEYNDGEDIGTVECGHEFHSGCIKQWLMQKNLCPICKTTALNK